jgi:rhamnose utilization protein RhaD (predicted bifunctional aldolase and dehydrogenase)/NAD(P)-dependent dehydrogenase (short-subunit alcohol dehydrogenase family)
MNAELTRHPLGPEVAVALDEITRASRALGADPALVLHGGGNTSIKATGTDTTGEAVELVLVKGSGWNLGTIEPAGFAPLRRARLLDLLRLDELDDARMVNELRQASLDADAPTASIEALLHAHLPARVALHSHADAIVALTHTEEAATRTAEVLGAGVLVLPYVMPGFELAKLIAEADLTGLDAIVLSGHGLFTFADTADAALERHLQLVARASEVLGVTAWGDAGAAVPRPGEALDIARLRRAVSDAAGHPVFLAQSDSSRALEFAGRDRLAELTSRGTATPEHVIYTKRTPLVGRDVAAYAAEYRAYVQRQRGRARDGAFTELDPAPRVVLDAELGLLTSGATLAAAAAARDIALHTMDVIDAADRLGGYRSFDEDDSFDIEYWSLEQAKLAKAKRRPLDGEVAVVTGAASGIGRAAAEALLAQGAAVVGIDLNPGVESVFGAGAAGGVGGVGGAAGGAGAAGAAGWRGVVGDVSDPEVLDAAFALAAREFGGVDLLVVAAGIFPESSSIADLDDAVWDRAMRVNATAVVRALRAGHPYLSLAPRGGRVVLVSTKNVTAPGPGAAAYSASKTAAAQLARVAALEWAGDGIRVNQVDPDAVFDTAIWTPELLAERAARYGLTVAEYRTRNLLGIEVTSALVADAVLAFCTGLPATTGAHLSVDGGNDRVV